MNRRKRMMDDLDQDIRDHIERETQDNIGRGMSPEEARYAAFRKFGNVTRVKEETREVWSFVWLEQLLQDIRYGLRMLRKSPGFTAIAVLTLALGIGANTAIFSVVHAVLLEPLPYPHSDRLTIVWSTMGKERRTPASGPELAFLSERSKLFQEFAGIWVTSIAVTGNDKPEQIRVGLVTSNFLPLLSPRPELGRFFTPEEQGGGRRPVIILSDGLWRRRFGADPGIIGRALQVNGGSLTVVGVMPPDFRLIFPQDASVPEDVQAYVPFQFDLAKNPRDLGFIRIIGLLRNGVSVVKAQSELDGIAAQLRSEFTEFSTENLQLTVVPLHGDAVRNARPALLALSGAVGLVLLIACANVASLLFARMNTRQREMTIRAALGAARARIVRQLLTESIFLSCLDGAAALLVGWNALQWLLSVRPEAIARIGTIQFDLSVFLFTLAVSVFTGILFGLAPAIGAAKLDLVDVLKEGGRGTTYIRRLSRNLMIVGEVALGFALLIGAGLMIQTFAGILRVNPGFRPAHVLTFRLSFAGASTALLYQIEKDISAQPGVESVGAVSHVPFDASLPNWYSYYWKQGATKDEQNSLMADLRSVLPGFLPSINASIIAGRNFTDFDDAKHPPVVVIDDLVARQVWPHESAVGKKLNVEIIDDKGQFVRQWAEVIGVVAHLQYHSLSNSVRGQVYMPYWMAPRDQMSFTVHTGGDPLAFVSQARNAVAHLDKDLPLSDIRTLDDYVAAARTGARFTAMLSGALAGIALLLACIGIYGVTSNSVLERTGEIGIRVALGAQRRDVLGLVLRQSVLPVICGSAIGIALSLGLAPLLSNLLFGVRPIDPVTFAAAAAVLLIVGVLACYVPARRAMRTDPIVALRYE